MMSGVSHVVIPMAIVNVDVVSGTDDDAPGKAFSLNAAMRFSKKRIERGCLITMGFVTTAICGYNEGVGNGEIRELSASHDGCYLRLHSSRLTTSPRVPH